LRFFKENKKKAGLRKAGEKADKRFWRVKGIEKYQNNAQSGQVVDFPTEKKPLNFR